jgi:hypothetical protein
MKHLNRFLPTEIAVLSLLFIMVGSLSAQTPTEQDCLGAIPVCQDIYVQETTYLGSGNYPNEIYNTPGNCVIDCPGSCLDGEQNSVWYVFTVQQSGALRLTIEPFFNEDDYDWAVYDITYFRCTDIYTQYPSMQKSCNAWGSSYFNGSTGINTAMGGTTNCNHCGDGAGTSKWNIDLPVTLGNTYVLVIENWGTTPQGGYTLDFSQSTAVIFDNVRPYLDVVDSEEITCGDAQITVEFSENVTCESVNPLDFVLSGPGGPYSVIDVEGEVCLLGGSMERMYTLYLDKPISEDGEYSLELTKLSFVYDACYNFASGNTLVFTVSLGAPEISEASLVINDATCGLSNGSITGLVVSGDTPFVYSWTDETGNPVGNELDLSDVPTGNYYLEVEDPNTCLASSGPYFVDQFGAPSVDEASMIINGANWGANNGSITGILVVGTEPLLFEWTDESSNTVGSEVDLYDVYTGNYFLHITDAYGCDTLTGPYFVPQIGGPLSVQSTAAPSSICIGESSQLMTNGSGGTGNYTFSWTSNPPGFTSDLQSPTVFPGFTTDYTVVIDDGYSVSQATVTVIVNPLPTAHAGNDKNIPYGTSVTLYGEGSGGSGNYEYSWEPESLLISPNSQNTATKNLYQTTIITLTLTDEATGCVSSLDTIVINLEGGPLGMTLATQKDTICLGETVLIQAFGFGGNEPYYTFTWLYNDQVVKQENNSTSSLEVNGITPGPETYKVVIWDGYNSDTISISVEVMDSPLFSIDGGPEVIACPYDSVLLSPDANFPGYTYYWSNGATSKDITVGTTGIGFDQRTYHLTVTTPYGCHYSDSVTVLFDFAACFGIEEYESFPSVKVYPNPTTGFFTVEFEDGEGFKELVILNSIGEIILEKDLTKFTKGINELGIDLKNYTPGVYFLRAINERFIYHQKLILN